MKKTNDYPINDRIIEKMKETGMDVRSLSTASGLSEPGLYKIIARKGTPNRRTVKAIAKALNANFPYLWTGKEGEELLFTDPTLELLFNKMDEEIKYLRSLIDQMRPKATANFNKALSTAGFSIEKLLGKAA